MTRRILLRVLFLPLMLLVPLPFGHAQVYRVTTLPTLNGGKATRHNPNVAYAINESGQVTGVSAGEAVVWTPGSGVQDIGHNSCLGCAPVGGINDLGDIVGLGDAGGFLWTRSGGMQALETSSQPSGVNHSDQVTGSFFVGPNQDSHAFLWSPANPVLQDLGTLGGSFSFAYGINDSGAIVGFSETSGGGESTFLWKEGTGMQPLPAALFSAFAINNQEQVAGSSSAGAAIWSQAGGIEDLGVLPGASGSLAVAISNRGTVVGNSWNTRPGFAFFWSPAQGMVNVNTLSNNKQQNWNAVGVNSAGQIVLNKKGGKVLLLTPVIAVALASSQNPSQVGEPVTFTAQASSVAGVPPDGEFITFLDSNTVLASVPLSGGTATFSTAGLAAGKHRISASYPGDVNYAASTSKAVKQVVR